MLILFIVIIFIGLISVFITNKIHLNIPSFFKRGFKKNDDEYGIYCFCGKQGCGKTFTLVDTLEQIRVNKIVICNIKSLCKSHNYVNSFNEINNDTEFVYCTDFYCIVDFLEKKGDNLQKYIIVYDEIFTLLEKGLLDKRCLSFISQMRKRKLYLLTTAQEWVEVNITFRRYVRYEIDCNMLKFPILGFAFSVNAVNDAYQMKWDAQQNEFVAPRIQTNVKKCSLAIAQLYDTFETIETSKNSNVKSRLSKF